MKTILCVIIAAFCSVSAMAQNEDWKLDFAAEARIDYQYNNTDGTTNDAATGFKGKHINIILNGKLGEHLSFNYRQRLNRAVKDESFFDATDWLHLNYHINENWTLSTGKQVVNIGGWEYDAAPIDLYGCSEYWHNIPCYRLGASAGYTFNKTGDKLIFQFCDSPFDALDTRNTYAYNLMWYGNHGIFSSAYSVNMIQVTRNQWINYISLGNKLNFSNFEILFDFMNRATSAKELLFKDFTVIAEVGYMIADRLNIFAKVSHDQNSTENYDPSVYAGTNLWLYGAGVEFYPIKSNKNLRLHANYFYSHGVNTNPAGGLADKMSVIDLGIKWKINVSEVLNRKIKQNN